MKRSVPLPARLDPEQMSPKVLFVDDEPALTDGIRVALRKEPYEILTANSAREGLEILGRTQVDVVVSDERMPGMSGSEFLTIVQERYPSTVRLILTGQASLDAAMQAINNASVYRFLVKPCSPQELAFCVSQAMEAREERQRFERWDAKEGSGRAQMGEVFDAALGTLRMFFQPIHRSADGTRFGYEALVRVVHEEIPGPDAFFRLAEELGRVQDVERAIRREVGRRMPEAPAGAQVLVNVHPHSLADGSLFAADSPLAPYAERIVLEITERDSVHDALDLEGKLAVLREHGFRIAVDDLGAGYAGLTSFALLCPEIVKFDMELIQGIHEAPTKAKLVGSITALCRELGIQTIAEGIELEAERDCAVALGCDLLQGYLYSPPKPEFE